MLTRLVVLRKEGEIRAEITIRARRITQGPNADQCVLTVVSHNVGRVPVSLAAVILPPPRPKP